jgi:hypothetical protein
VVVSEISLDLEELSDLRLGVPVREIESSDLGRGQPSQGIGPERRSLNWQPRRILPTQGQGHDVAQSTQPINVLGRRTSARLRSIP